MATLFALLILVIIVAVAFWIVDKVKSSNSTFPPLAFTIAYVIIALFALVALYAIATGVFALPTLK